MERIRKSEIVSELIENKEGKTAKHIENEIKEEKFMETVEKERLLVE